MNIPLFTKLSEHNFVSWQRAAQGGGWACLGISSISFVLALLAGAYLYSNTCKQLLGRLIPLSSGQAQIILYTNLGAVAGGAFASVVLFHLSRAFSPSAEQNSAS